MTFGPEFVVLEDVFYLHEKQLERYGGTQGIRSQELLESAVMTPQASFDGEYVHKTLCEMAAAYAFHIAENQPFVDGNKRAALGTALLFLDLNGVELNDAEGKLYQAMIDISSKTLTKSGLTDLLKKLVEETAEESSS